MKTNETLYTVTVELTDGGKRVTWDLPVYCTDPEAAVTRAAATFTARAKAKVRLVRDASGKPLYADLD